jgi:hypothetical protein
MAIAMPSNPNMRASDADRERTSTLLREHHAEGRLTGEEFHERLDAAYAAKTLGDLDALLVDLPAIDLYRLPAAGLRPAPRGTGNWQTARSANIARYAGGPVTPRQVGQWVVWAGSSGALFLAWLIIGAVVGGIAWVPWFLLIVIPWAISLARRP